MKGYRILLLRSIKFAIEKLQLSRTAFSTSSFSITILCSLLFLFNNYLLLLLLLLFIIYFLNYYYFYLLLKLLLKYYYFNAKKIKNSIFSYYNNYFQIIYLNKLNKTNE